MIRVILSVGDNMTIMIAYYSWQGHTEKVAKALADSLDAELVKIEAEKEVGMFSKVMKAAFAKKAPIKPCKTDLAGVDQLIIASPVWVGKIPPYMNEYLDNVTGAEGKPFYVVMEMGGSGAESATKLIRKHLENKGMTFVSSTATIEKEVESGEFMKKVEDFAKEIRGES